MSVLKELIHISQLNLNTTKTLIASYILENLKVIESITLEQIALQTYTSKPTVTRFAKSFGYKGWSDFLPELLKSRSYESQNFSNIDHSHPFTDSDNISDIIQKMAIIQKESIQDTANKIVDSDVKKAVQAIDKANDIILFGLSPNNYLAELFRHKLLTIGKNCQIAPPDEYGLMSSTLKRNDLAIIISYSGKIKNFYPYRFFTFFQKNHIKTIGISGENAHYLREKCDINFTICTREDKYKKIGSFSSDESITFILNTLFAAYFAKNFWKNYSYKVSTLTQLQDVKMISLNKDED